MARTRSNFPESLEQTKEMNEKCSKHFSNFFIQSGVLLITLEGYGIWQAKEDLLERQWN